jgi:hypothetical protein
MLRGSVGCLEIGAGVESLPSHRLGRTVFPSDAVSSGSKFGQLSCIRAAIPRRWNPIRVRFGQRWALGVAGESHLRLIGSGEGCVGG